MKVEAAVLGSRSLAGLTAKLRALVYDTLPWRKGVGDLDWSVCSSAECKYVLPLLLALLMSRRCDWMDGTGGGGSRRGGQFIVISRLAVYRHVSRQLMTSSQDLTITAFVHDSASRLFNNTSAVWWIYFMYYLPL